MRWTAPQNEHRTPHALQFLDKRGPDRGTLFNRKRHRSALHVALHPSPQPFMLCGRRRVLVISAGMNAMIARPEAALIAENPLPMVMTDAVYESLWPHDRRHIFMRTSSRHGQQSTTNITRRLPLTPGLTNGKTRIGFARHLQSGPSSRSRNKHFPNAKVRSSDPACNHVSDCRPTFSAHRIAADRIRTCRTQPALATDGSP
jgi:hypothetical protein